jgi:hypothetical protein
MVPHEKGPPKEPSLQKTRCCSWPEKRAQRPENQLLLGPRKLGSSWTHGPLEVDPPIEHSSLGRRGSVDVAALAIKPEAVFLVAKAGEHDSGSGLV